MRKLLIGLDDNTVEYSTQPQGSHGCRVISVCQEVLCLCHKFEQARHRTDIPPQRIQVCFANLIIVWRKNCQNNIHTAASWQTRSSLDGNHTKRNLRTGSIPCTFTAWQPNWKGAYAFSAHCGGIIEAEGDKFVCFQLSNQSARPQQLSCP